MITPQEMKDRYTGLYDYMAQSRDPKNMKAFGSDVAANVLTTSAFWLLGKLFAKR